jgi:hypothetical protein
LRGAGLLFGNVPIVKQNFSLVAIGIVVVSLLPMASKYSGGPEVHRVRGVTGPRVVCGPDGPGGPIGEEFDGDEVGPRSSPRASPTGESLR